jgi:hypothetical protein
MPFDGEPSSATAHQDFIRNPDVSAFLKDCEFLAVPDGKELDRLKSLFESYSIDGEPHPVDHALATDGSVYESQIDPRLPSTRACYVKVSSVLIKMNEFRGLTDASSGLVDPFRVAALKENNNVLTIALPSTNLRRKGEKSPRSTFRRELKNFFHSAQTRFDPTDDSTSLAATYAALASLRTDGGAPPNTVRVHKCPNPDCGQPNHHVPFARPYTCPTCGDPIYMTDSLRLWEEVDDFKSSMEPSSRFMTYLEHLLPIHYMRFLLARSPAVLARTAFFVDNPLAIFGNAAWLHACIMRFLYNMRKDLKAKGIHPPLIIGLQKTGQLVDFGSMVTRSLAPGTCFAVTDDFRQQYIGSAKSKNGFGAESYYGQDFYVKTHTGKLFVLSLPYPFEAKTAARLDFDTEKSKRANYPDLARACALIEEVETDLWENALAPVALAHRYTAISLVPSGRILDILGRALVNDR